MKSAVNERRLFQGVAVGIGSVITLAIGNASSFLFYSLSNSSLFHTLQGTQLTPFEDGFIAGLVGGFTGLGFVSYYFKRLKPDPSEFAVKKCLSLVRANQLVNDFAALNNFSFGAIQTNTIRSVEISPKSVGWFSPQKLNLTFQVWSDTTDKLGLVQCQALFSSSPFFRKFSFSHVTFRILTLEENGNQVNEVKLDLHE